MIGRIIEVLLLIAKYIEQFITQRRQKEDEETVTQIHDDPGNWASKHFGVQDIRRATSMPENAQEAPGPSDGKDSKAT